MGLWPSNSIILLFCFVLIGSFVLALRYERERITQKFLQNWNYFRNSWCKYERGKRRRKVTFEEETAVVEIDEEERDYGATAKVTQGLVRGINN